MCIIIAKYRGNKLPKKETLENCFYNNNDGAGISYTHDGKVYIDKGYNKFNEFYKRLKELDKKYNLKNENVLLHFRIGTSGNMDARATHPFPISASAKKLQAPKLDKLNIAIAHNGVISDYAYKNENNLSDTQNFIKDFLEPLQELNKNFYKNKKILQVIQNECKSKLAIIDNNDITLIGEFIQGDDKNFYSNASYKQDYYKTTYSKYYNSFNWSDYDYYDDGYKNNYKGYEYKDGANLMILDKDYYIQEDATDNLDEIYKSEEWQAIDENYNLYDIVDYYTGAKNKTYFKLDKIAKNIILLDSELNVVSFKPNANEWSYYNEQ